MRDFTFRRFIYSILGVVLISIAVSLFRIANIGTDPFSCFNLGIAGIIGTSFGNAQLIVNIVLTILFIYPGWKYFGVGTVIAMFGVGYISDIVLSLLGIPEGEFNFFISLLLVIAGIVITSSGIAMYSSANLGISQYDMMGFLLRDTGVLSLQYARIVVDIVLVVAGFFMGSIVNVGTLLIALFVGPLVAWLIPNVMMPLVNGK